MLCCVPIDRTEAGITLGRTLRRDRRTGADFKARHLCRDRAAGACGGRTSVSGARSGRGRESHFVRARLWTSVGTAGTNGGVNAGHAAVRRCNVFIYKGLW